MATTGCQNTHQISQSRLARDLDAAIERAANHLQSRQADSGAWPSQTYGLFGDGIALTPHVLRSLVQANRDNHSTRRAMGFVEGKVRFELPTGARNGGHFLDPNIYGPVYFCSDAVLSKRVAPFTMLGLSNILLEHQIRDPNRLAFAQSGGWGYGHTPHQVLDDQTIFRVRFDHGRCVAGVAPNLSANISSTVYALDAIAFQQWPKVQHLPIQNARLAALRFSARCQNFDSGDKRFDDGGFFFNPADPARNKGGPAGADRRGFARFHSSGSSTADGLRVLLRCGADLNDPRVAAARDWLFKHFDTEHHPGTFNADREVLRDAYYFYYAASVADTFTLLGQGPDGWAQQLAASLIKRQNADGSFVNPYTDGKEDDPLIATPFALRAMVACREALGAEK